MPLDELNTVLDCLLQRKSQPGELGSRADDPAIASIARDLEMLLNVRRERNLIPAAYERAAGSILNFGVPEFDHFGDLSVQAEQDRLCGALEEVITTFESRLREVRVQVMDLENAKHILRIRVEALVVTIGEVRAFDAKLTRRSGRFTVGGVR